MTRLASHPFKIFVFVGANQVKVSYDLASAIQESGADAKYIKISGNGPNALDLHIAFYIGELSIQNFGVRPKWHLLKQKTNVIASRAAAKQSF